MNTLLEELKRLDSETYRRLQLFSVNMKLPETAPISMAIIQYEIQNAIDNKMGWNLIQSLYTFHGGIYESHILIKQYINGRELKDMSSYSSKENSPTKSILAAYLKALRGEMDESR